jgi:N-methylhydantoinase A
VLSAIQDLLSSAGMAGQDVATVAHGTTVATNAVLEQSGARTALVTTAGFRDVLELRRIRAPQLYDLFFQKPPPLVPRHLRLEVAERMAADGAPLVVPQPAQLREIAGRLRAAGVESVAVCLLHSFAHPEHEKQVTACLREQLADVPISASHEVLRERREYERTATTVVNAYVRPVMETYLEKLRGGLERHGVSAPLLIMQSAGGLMPEEDARTRPVFALESGPAAGVLAGARLARRCKIANAITFDMGGTTSKASLIENGKWHYSPEYEVGASLSAGNRLVGGAGEVIRAPTIDIAEVGAGGGSIALLDRAGGLRVGPRSAGSMPGPVCYGRGGTQVTLTDANAALGYLRAGELADGQVKIDVDAARRAIHDQIAAPLGLSIEEAADGIHRIANARTMRALRSVSIERGRDPREFALIAFGGAGPIHAARLAAELNSPTVIVPPLPGLFSALGLLLSGVEHHAAHSCQLYGDSLTPGAVSSRLDALRREMLDQFEREGYARGGVAFEAAADLRYRGQTSEVQVSLSAEGIDARSLRRSLAAFEDEHERLFGHRSQPGSRIEIVTIRLIGRVAEPDCDRTSPASQVVAPQATRRDAWFGKEHGRISTPVISRSDLSDPLSGPLLLDEYDATTVIPPGVRAHCDAFGNVVMHRDNESERP